MIFPSLREVSVVEIFKKNPSPTDGFVITEEYSHLHLPLEGVDLAIPPADSSALMR